MIAIGKRKQQPANMLLYKLPFALCPYADYYANMAIAVHIIRISVPERRGSTKVLTGLFLRVLRRVTGLFLIIWIIWYS